MFRRHVARSAGRMRRRHLKRSGHRSWYFIAQRHDPRRRRSRFSWYARRFEGYARWLQANSIAVRSGHRRERRATRKPDPINGTLLRGLSDAESTAKHPGFASGHVALKSVLCRYTWTFTIFRKE